jgi:hypothetical protein
MAVEISRQRRHGASPASNKPLVPVCCICQLLRDEAEITVDHERWVTKRTYRKAHGATPNDARLTHTYCPNCFSQLMGRIMRAA